MKLNLREVEIDIALMAGYMIAKKEIIVGDSRELSSNIMIWANEFIEIDPINKSECSDEDYILLIDLFATQKLLKEYGVAKVES